MVEPEFVIAGERFRYKKDVEARIRAIKDRTPMCTDLEGQDKRFVLAFFAWHPTKSERVSEAVCVRVMRDSGEGGRRFEFYFADVQLDGRDGLLGSRLTADWEERWER